jgi:hypothetical protein
MVFGKKRKYVEMEIIFFPKTGKAKLTLKI